MKTTEVESKLPNMIGPGTKIVGNIQTNGDFKIDGNIEGNVSSKGKIVVGINGFIKGEIICANAIISGTVNGKLVVSELLSMQSSSKISGDIRATKLSIEPGAIFSGTCTMGSDAKMQTPPLTEVKK
jgi:cytoskeletal protein CcmA (bactofilin family)